MNVSEFIFLIFGDDAFSHISETIEHLVLLPSVTPLIWLPFAIPLLIASQLADSTKNINETINNAIICVVVYTAINFIANGQHFNALVGFYAFSVIFQISKPQLWTTKLAALLTVSIAV